MKLLSQKQTRKHVLAQTLTTAQLERVVVGFLNRGFWRRLRWLFFGH
jgi:hypothetical protein